MREPIVSKRKESGKYLAEERALNGECEGDAEPSKRRIRAELTEKGAFRTVGSESHPGTTPRAAWAAPLQDKAEKGAGARCGRSSVVQEKGGHCPLASGGSKQASRRSLLKAAVLSSMTWTAAKDRALAARALPAGQ